MVDNRIIGYRYIQSGFPAFAAIFYQNGNGVYVRLPTQHDIPVKDMDFQKRKKYYPEPAYRGLEEGQIACFLEKDKIVINCPENIFVEIEKRFSRLHSDYQLESLDIFLDSL